MRDFAPSLPVPPGAAVPAVGPAGPAPVSRRQWLAGAALASLSPWAEARQRRAAAESGAAASAASGPAAADGADALPPPLRALLARSGLPAASIGLQIQSVLPGQRPLARCNAEHAYQLASTSKVVTALAALSLLGPDYRWRTQAFLTGPLRDGRLLGDLVIVGGGDAFLRSADLRNWFVQMQAQGLREVWGDIVLDRQAFQFGEGDFASTPPPSVDRPHHARPDALTLDEGALRVSLQADAKGRPQVQVQPPLAGLKVSSSVSSAAGGCDWRAQWAQDSGLNPSLQVSGSWRPGCAAREQVLAPLPHGEFTERAVQVLWREAGGRMKGRVVNRALPALPTDGQGQPAAAWSTHQGEPLAQVLRDINKTSDNLGARNLMLSLARGFPQRPATLADAQQRLSAWLARQGLQPGDIAVDTGAGLSRGERGKPRAMVQLLRHAWFSDQARPFIDSLPVAGVDGTLMHRMTHGAATGRAFLKTGTLLDTRALAGYVQAASGQVYAVAALVNHAEAQRATPMLDAAVEWLAQQG